MYIPTKKTLTNIANQHYQAQIIPTLTLQTNRHALSSSLTLCVQRCAGARARIRERVHMRACM